MNACVWVALSAADRARYFDRETEQLLRRVGRRVVRRGEAELAPATTRRLLAATEAFVTCRGGSGLTAEQVASAPRLRFIGVIGSSVKHVAPEAALARGITVVNSAAAIGYGVAEFTLGLMITTLHRVFPCRDSVRSGGWGEDVPLGRELRGRTVGLLGVGSVGRQVAVLLRPFRTRTLVYDPYLTARQARALGVARAPLTVLLRQADVVSIHCGLTPETRGLIGARELGLLKTGALLINTARGPIIDETALLAELRTGRIQAALDVFCNEPLPADSPFRVLPNCIATPHKPGGTVDTYRAEGRMVTEDLCRFLAGETPVNRLAAAQLARMT